MNKSVIIPPTWRPGCTRSLNRWYTKIYREARKQKGLNKIRNEGNITRSI